MIYIALNVLFNAMLLSITFILVGALLPNHIPEYYFFIAGYVVSGALTIIGYTRFASAIVGFFIGGRKLVGREMARIEPLLKDIIQQCNDKYGTTYHFEDFVLRVTDSKVINAYALGHNLICIDSGSFDGFNDEQLKAVLAHEMGHLFYKDSVKSIALIFSSFGTRLVMWIYSIVAIVQAIFANIAASIRDKNGVGGMMAILSFIPILMFIPVIILNWIGNKVFYLINMAISRRAEYRADAFAASLGYQDGMIGALEIFHSISARGNSFIDKLIATHPAPMQRIGALEDDEVQKSRIGRLKIATPFVSVTASRELSDFVMLSIFVVDFGVAWCGYFTYINLTGQQNILAHSNINNSNMARHKVTHKSVQRLHIATPVNQPVAKPQKTNVLNAPVAITKYKHISNNAINVTSEVTRSTHELYHVTSVKPIYEMSAQEYPVKRCTNRVDSMGNTTQECDTITREKPTKLIDGYNVEFKDSDGDIVTEVTHNRPAMKNYTMQQIKEFN